MKLFVSKSGLSQNPFAHLHNSHMIDCNNAFKSYHMNYTTEEKVLCSHHKNNIQG